MRFLFASLLLFLAVAGCARPVDASACAAGSDLGDDGIDPQPDGRGASRIVVDVLHDGRPNRDIVVCAQVNGQLPFGAAIEGSNAIPNARRLADGYLLDAESFDVFAFVPDDDVARAATFPMTETNHVIVVVQADHTLRIDKHDEVVAFS